MASEKLNTWRRPIMESEVTGLFHKHPDAAWVRIDGERYLMKGASGGVLTLAFCEGSKVSDHTMQRGLTALMQLGLIEIPVYAPEPLPFPFFPPPFPVWPPQE